MESENIHDEQIEQLQQRAAALYLRGQFGEALGVWNELLGVDGGNERAREGVRLCEILTRRQVTPAHRLRPSVDAPAEAEPVDAPARAEPVDATPAPEAADDLSQVDAFFDGLADAAPPAPEVAPEAAPEAAPAPAPQAGDPSQTMAIDLSSLNLELDPPAAPAAESEGLDFGLPMNPEGETTALGLGTDAPLGSDQPPVEESMEAAAERAAQAELRRRVHQLVSEAEAAEAAGDSEQAERLCERVLILDEQETRAAAILRRLRGEPDPAPAIGLDSDSSALPAADDEAADDGFPSYDEVAPGFEATSQDAAPADDLLGAVPGGDLLGEVPTPPLADGDAPAPPQAELSPDLPEPELGEKSAEELDALERAAARLAAYHAEENSVVSVRRVLPVVGFGIGGLLLLGAIGWGVMAMTGGDDAVEQQAGLAPQLAKKKKKKSAPPVAEPARPQVDPGTLDAWVDQATAAHENGDYAAALELYDRVLEADPEHVAAKAGVAVTVDVYQRRQQLSRKEREAYDAFDRGDYRTALRSFYRLPDETGGDYTGEIANGWYNLALISLNSAECANAEGFLGEVGDRVESDATFARLWDLTVACPDEQGTPWFAEQLAKIAPRKARD